MSTTSKELVQMLIKFGWNNENFEAAKDLLVDETAQLPTDETFTFRGRQSILNLIEEYQSCFPKSKLEIRDEVAEGNTVVTRVTAWTSNDKRRKPFPGDFTLSHCVLNDKIAAAEMTPELSQLAKAGPRLLYIATNFLSSSISSNILLIVFMVCIAFGLFYSLNRYAEGRMSDWLAEDTEMLSQDLRLEQPLTLYRQVSTDSKRVVLVTDAQLDPQMDTNTWLDVYVYDFDKREFILVSRGIITTTDGITQTVAGNSWSIDPFIADDGKTVLFLSYADNLVPEKNLPKPANFQYNLETKDMKALHLSSDITANLQPDALWWTSSSRFERARILKQYDTARMMAQKHQKLVKFFFSNQFAYLLCTFAATITSALALFIIARVGWSLASSRTITLFIVATSLAVWFGTVPNIFSLAGNLEINTTSYIYYVNMTNLIRSYVGTGEVINSAGNREVTEASAFILSVDRLLVEGFSLPVKLDSNALPSRNDILNLFEVPQLIATPTTEPPASESTAVPIIAPEPSATATP